ncbi:hypothetical protein [Halobacterium bonnevillei]|uniref:Uncharacterized protein n=1 Tax=Halobacterium bonnevillei TaxID=2692200 RepID=A0A6B0SHR7_9EURY|nr:hypothetical protein [Halobacterium bonnevillei]MXR19421.1 hypothetical protein [Halobacterium bonnevillei]
MSLDDLETDVELASDDLDDYEFLDRESRQELAMLSAALDADTDELLRRAVHVLFQSTTETGRLDFHLRSTYGVTYDEYLSGMTYDQMAGGTEFQQSDDDRRYQF